jgi:hypothetical protein
MLCIYYQTIIIILFVQLHAQTKESHAQTLLITGLETCKLRNETIRKATFRHRRRTARTAAVRIAQPS